jgi:hypothetical protein
MIAVCAETAGGALTCPAPSSVPYDGMEQAVSTIMKIKITIFLIKKSPSPLFFVSAEGDILGKI